MIMIETTKEIERKKRQKTDSFIKKFLCRIGKIFFKYQIEIINYIEMVERLMSLNKEN